MYIHTVSAMNTTFYELSRFRVSAFIDHYDSNYIHVRTEFHETLEQIPFPCSGHVRVGIDTVSLSSYSWLLYNKVEKRIAHYMRSTHGVFTGTPLEYVLDPAPGPEFVSVTTLRSPKIFSKKVAVT